MPGRLRTNSLENSSNIPFVDYSQASSWLKCPWLWFERSVNKVHARPKALREDALCIGSLVHAGLEVWQRDHRVAIPEAAIEEFNPSPLALTLCRMMVAGYSNAFPAERWPRLFCEQPLRFPLCRAERFWSCAKCGSYGKDNVQYCLNPDCLCPVTNVADGFDYDGLAKIDCWFEVPEQTTLESGTPEYDCTLTPGIWIHEYKTKAESRAIGNFMQEWEVKLQADFQLLALQEALGKPAEGLLINCIEKPKVYTPKRKCQKCGQTVELPSWLPGTSGASACPLCQNQQVLAKGNSAPTIGQPKYTRFVVRRSQEQLERSKVRIQKIAEAMQQALLAGLDSLVPNTEACVDWRFGPCEYFSNHTYGNSTLDDPSFVQIADYVKEVQA